MNEQNTIENELLLTVQFLSGEVPTDLYVFDQIITIRMSNGTWKFYERPLVMGNLGQPLTLETNSVTLDTSMRAADFAFVQEYGILEFFAVAPGKVHKYTFTYK